MNMEKKLNSLKEYVKDKALAEADEIRKEAQKKAKEIEEEYRKKADKEYEKLIKEAREKAELLERREISKAYARSSKMVLDAKNDVLSKALEEFRDAVFSLVKGKEYDKVLKNLTLEAIKTLGEKEAIVIVRAQDVERMKKIAQQISKDFDIRIDVRTSDEEIAGGVIVSTKEGHIVVENTLENKFEESKDGFVSELFSILNVDR